MRETENRTLTREQIQGVCRAVEMACDGLVGKQRDLAAAAFLQGVNHMNPNYGGLCWIVNVRGYREIERHLKGERAEGV